MTTGEITNQDLLKAITQLAAHVDKCFDAIDRRFEQIEHRLFALETQMISMSREMREANERTEHIDGRLEAAENDIVEIYSKLPASEPA